MDDPTLATEVALAVLHWISEGHGHDLTGQDVHDPDRYAQERARVLGQEDRVALRLRPILTGDSPTRQWTRQVLGLSDPAAPPMAALQAMSALHRNREATLTRLCSAGASKLVGGCPDACAASLPDLQRQFNR